jgi:uncharacterized protein involved in exopolysaccharide biosynthesis
LISEIVQILNRRKWQILITFFSIVGVVAAVTFLMPKKYETRMKILVKSERTAGNGYGSGGDVSENQVNTEMEMLTSNNLLEQVVKWTGLQKNEDVSSLPAAEQQPVAMEKAVRRLEHDLKIAPVRKASIIEVTYTATNPRSAAAVLRQFADKYLEAHLQARSTPGSYDFFTAQASHYKDELTAIEVELANFSEKDNVVLLAQEKEAMLQKSMEAKSALLQVEAAINEYQSKAAHTKDQLASVDGRVVTQSRVVSNQYLTERLNTMLAELQNKRTQLLTKFQPEDRSVKEVDQEIADTKSALERATKQNGLEQTTDVNPLRQSLEIDMAKAQSELAGLQAKRTALSTQDANYHSQLMRLDEATAQYDDLVRHRKEVEDNYLMYSKKAEEARIAESLDRQKISNVAIIETPTEPHLPSKPNVPLNLAVGTVLAAFVSLGIAFTMEFGNRPPRLPVPQFGLALNESPEYSALGGSKYLLSPVKGPADLEELTGVPVLALVDGR